MVTQVVLENGGLPLFSRGFLTGVTPVPRKAPASEKGSHVRTEGLATLKTPSRHRREAIGGKFVGGSGNFETHRTKSFQGARKTSRVILAVHATQVKDNRWWFFTMPYESKMRTNRYTPHKETTA